MTTWELRNKNWPDGQGKECGMTGWKQRKGGDAETSSA